MQTQTHRHTAQHKTIQHTAPQNKRKQDKAKQCQARQDSNQGYLSPCPWEAAHECLVRTRAQHSTLQHKRTQHSKTQRHSPQHNTRHDKTGILDLRKHAWGQVPLLGAPVPLSLGSRAWGPPTGRGPMGANGETTRGDHKGRPQGETTRYEGRPRGTDAGSG